MASKEKKLFLRSLNGIRRSPENQYAPDFLSRFFTVSHTPITPITETPMACVVGDKSVTVLMSDVINSPIFNKYPMIFSLLVVFRYQFPILSRFCICAVFRKYGRLFIRNVY